MRAVGYKPSALTADTSRKWSKNIWAGIPWDQIACGEREGHAFFDDFSNMPNLSADADLHKYAAFVSTGNTISQSATDEHGAVAVVTDGTDEDESWIQTGGNTGAFLEIIKEATGVPHTIAFEARVKKSLITSGCLFIGLGAEGMAADNSMVDTTGAMADNNWIGFHVLEAAPATMTFSYKNSGQTVQNLMASYATLVADTYIKVGFLYDYKHKSSQKIKVFKNGVVQSTYVTKALLEAATFPFDEEMCPLFGVKNTTAVAISGTMDWWRAALVVNG